MGLSKGNNIQLKTLLLLTNYNDISRKSVKTKGCGFMGVLKLFLGLEQFPGNN